MSEVIITVGLDVLLNVAGTIANVLGGMVTCEIVLPSMLW